MVGDEKTEGVVEGQGKKLCTGRVSLINNYYLEINAGTCPS